MRDGLGSSVVSISCDELSTGDTYCGSGAREMLVIRVGYVFDLRSYRGQLFVVHVGDLFWIDVSCVRLWIGYGLLERGHIRYFVDNYLQL